MDKHILPNEELIWKLIDGVLPAGEKQQVEELVEKDAAWAALYKELLQLHRLVAVTEPEQPSMRFTRNVMDEVSRYAAVPTVHSYINKRVVRAIIALLGLVALAGVAYLIGLASVPSQDVGNVGYFQWAAGVFPTGTVLFALVLLNLLAAGLWVMQYLRYKKIKAGDTML